MRKRPRYKPHARRIRVLLDTNVWRYLADHNAGADLLRASLAGKAQIVVAPSVVYEALRMGDPELRKRQLVLMTSPKWTRLMPEAYSESQELLGEIKRLRPEWLHPNPDLTIFKRYRHDWMRRNEGFWDRARFTPALEVDSLARKGDREQLELARAQSRLKREEITDAPWTVAVPLNTMEALLPKPRPGWDGNAIEPWRLDGWFSTGRAFRDEHHPYRDWLSSEVAIDAMLADDVSWLRFWFYDIEANRMPRFWLRWALEFLQRFRKVTDGTPADSQLATYLFEADLFISADKALVNLIDRCRPQAPFPVPESRLIPADRKGVTALLEMLKAL